MISQMCVEPGDVGVSMGILKGCSRSDVLECTEDRRDEVSFAGLFTDYMGYVSKMAST